jgi:hypothetical protein
LALLLLAVPAALRAQWKEATTDHFVVYSDTSADKLERAAADLERYDFLLRRMLNLPREHPVKVRVYLLPNMSDVGRSLGYGSNSGVAGYYTASSRGPMAVGMRNPVGSVEYGVDGQTVLFHEYAHHLMYQNSQAALPLWYSEGFAEYYGTTRVLPDAFEVGQIARDRRAWFKDYGDWLPLKQLLTSRNYKDIDNKVGLLYAQGWLLVHYLSDNPERSGQLARYLGMINAGSDFKKAMDTAFGPDAKELDAELRRYSRRQQLPALRISFQDMNVGKVTVRSLTAARSALMDEEIELSRGIYSKDAANFAAAVRKKAQAFPRDPHALAMLTFAERLAGNRDAAAAAADRWLAAAPSEARAHLMKGLLAVDRLAAAKSTEPAAWAAARASVAKAKQMAPSDPLILEGYYDSFAADGSLPPAAAQNALVSALELVPQDDELRYRVASDLERRGYVEDAMYMIMPAAFGAHQSDDETEKQKAKRERREERWRQAGKDKHETPREMLARLQAKLTAQAAK